MKNKPQKHKEKNRFKFQPFSERIANVKIDVYHLVKHKNEEESDEVTFFYQSLEKWTLLNCSESFQELKNEISNNVQILPQILVLKDQLIEILKKHLSNKNPLTLQAVLELIVALAKDLRQEFAPYFLPIYELLVPLLSIADAEIIEQTFQCLAYLFKFLWRHLAKNLPTVFDSILPLLSSNKPQYIINFAAQSFAFVARKAQDSMYMIRIILKSLKKYNEVIEGCGRLMFEILRGIPGQFHSSAERTLNSLFSAINDVSLSGDLIWQLIHNTVCNIVKYINVDHIPLLWKVVLEHISNIYSSWTNDKNEINSNNLKEILNTVLQIVDTKDCRYLLETEKVINSLQPFLDDKNVDQKIIGKISEIFAPILLAPSLNLSLDFQKQILNSAITHFNEEILISFITKILSYKNFERILLELLMEFCKTVSPKKILPLLTKIILFKAPNAKNVQELINWSQYNLNFNNEYSDKYLKILDEISEQYLENFDDFISILIIIPHIKPLNKNKTIEIIQKLIEKIANNLSETKILNMNEISKKQSIYLLCQLLETLIYLKPEVPIPKLCLPENIISNLLPYANVEHLYVLRTLDLYIIMDETNETSSFAAVIKKKLLSNLLSPYHKVRQYTIHILYELEKTNKTSNLMITLLDICWKAEMTQLTLTEYREKIKYLQKLDPTNESVHEAIIREQLDYQLFIRYLIGVLYANFKLIWPPISKIIINYINVLPPNQVWPVIGGELIRVATVIRDRISEPVILSPFQSKYLEEVFMNLYELEERPDHVNHRILLWEILAECLNVCEAKNRDIVTQFLLFLESEYWKRHYDHAKFWDISMKNNDSTVNDNIENVNDLTEEEMDVDVNEENESDSLKKEELGNESITTFDVKNKSVIKSLLVHLKVLGKNRSPKNVHREPELYVIYIELLSHKLADVQRSALDCLMMYKHKYLLTYREHLYGLIDDKTFRKEVTIFRIDKESDVIRSEHRKDLIPIVLRIVYSKLYSKGSAIKGMTKQERKASIIRFLAGCSSEELNSFFNMAFAIFHEKIEKYDNPLSLAEKTISELDLEHVIPPRRLQSQIYLLNTVLIYCGGLLENNQQNYLLQILISISGHVAGVFRHRERVHTGYVKILRDIRNACFDVLIKFYEKFDNYEWNKDETDAVFKVFIWPYLTKLPIEGIYSPTAQLKLFITWSNNPRYFVLLGKYNEDDQKMAPLQYIIELWLSPRIHGSVSNAILNLIENLLTFVPDDTDSEISTDYKRIEVRNPAIICKEKLSVLKRTVNYGSRLLLPYIPNILELLQKKLSTKQGLNRKDMEVMSILTELVTEPESSDKLLYLLLPQLMKKSGSGEEVIIPLLNTTYNLIKNVEDPGRYVRKLAPLYGTVEGPAARKLLFSIVIELSKQTGSECGLDEELLCNLNAWDIKWIDQPDFNRRFKAFKTIETMIKENKISVNLGVIIIHTCFHFIRTEKDMSLRENSRYCLVQLCPSLSNSLQDNIKDKNFVISTILNLIRKGLMEKQSESVRYDSISLLGLMARECAFLHPILDDLSRFCNKTDLEVDMFENLHHLQLHRRVRAFLKFSTVGETLEKPLHPRTLMEFILPLISHYLLSEKYSSKHTIIDGAIKALGTTCRMLPWRQYQSILLYYIQKLQENIEYQKQLVRIVVEILNSFHFDLSLAEMSVLEKIGANYNRKDGKNKSKIEEGKLQENSAEDETNEKSVENVEDEIQINVEEDSEISKIKETESESTQLLLSQVTKLTKANATRVIRLIAETLLPQLYKTLAQRTQVDVQHKLNRKTTGPDRDEEDVLRIPLAVAVVKLLQKLPSKKMLDTHLPGIFMKLCTFLKSRLDSVRRVTRETIQTIMLALGTDYLPLLIHEMSTLLTRGYQVHVLVYSLHSVLKILTPHLKKGDLDKCHHLLLKVCSKDLFGSTSEEKEVNQILGKLMEARANRSYDIYHILASYISENYLLNIIFPLKEELSKTMSHKIVTKVRQCLQQVVLGLTENVFVSSQSLLEFAFGTASESIPALTADSKLEQLDPKQVEYESRKQPDSYLLSDEPKKKKALESITCIRTNANLLVEFGLRLFYFLFKREKLKDQDYTSHLDPIVTLLSDCLKSQHVKITTLAIQCLCWILKMDLPSVHEQIKTISKELFLILHKYASAGLSNKGDNYELVMTTFKAVAVIVRDIKYHQLEDDQMRTLLLYCEQDLDNYARQVTAFSLLKAVIKKKVKSPELKEIMKKVGRLSITSDQDSIRLQARQVMLHYILEYPLGKNIKVFLSFYFSQLNYRQDNGRISALEMIKNITNAFPIKALQSNCAVIFVNVSTSLVNDPQPGCRKQAAEIIGLLLNRINNNCKNKLFDVTKLWLEDLKVVHRRLAAQVIGLFVAAEQEKFEKRLKVLLPLITRQFVEEFHETIPGRFVLLNPPKPIRKDDAHADHHLYQVLQMIVKIASICPSLLTNKKYIDHMETIAEKTQTLLGHPHEWVRYAAVQMLGQIISATPVTVFADVINDPSNERPGYLLTDTSNKLRALSLDVIAQLISTEEEVNEKFLMQCMKLLVYIAEIAKNIKSNGDLKQLSLEWLVKRIKQKINLEVIHTPKSIIVRKMCFNWTAAIAVKLTRIQLEPIANLLLQPLVREINQMEDNNNNNDNILGKIAKESASYIKNKIGNDAYRIIVADITKHIEIKKATRRKERTQLMVTDPERAAKRKINKQLKKKALKKRKLELIKNHTFKKRVRKDDEDE